MTEKLFWKDAYETEFTAAIVDQFPLEAGHAVVLDRTCFYATSGGQPNDLGTLNMVPVTDVRFDGERLLHVLSKPLEGASAAGVINWSRRFDHMQQHSGQHVLSAAFFKLFHAETSSFHLGEDYCSIELSRPDLKENQIREAEELANQVIFSATPVTTFFVDPQDAKAIPLRKQSDLAESLRIIQMGDFDLSPCSGTHVRNAAEIGVIFIRDVERVAQKLKVSFLCGNRVRKQYAKDVVVLKALSKTLTTSVELIPESVDKLLAQAKEYRKEAQRVHETKLKAEAMQLLLNAEDWHGNHLMVTIKDRPYDELRYLAQRLSEQRDVVGVFVSSSDRRAVFFKNRDVAADLKGMFQEFLAKTSAKGGGPPHFMEAGNLQGMEGLEEYLKGIWG